MNQASNVLSLSDHVELIVLFGLLSFIACWIAKKRGLFRFSHPMDTPLSIPFKTVITAFGIYLGISIGVAAVGGRLLSAFGKLSPSMINGLQLFIIILNIAALGWFCFTRHSLAIRRIWKDPLRANPASLTKDFLVGVGAWFVSFPVVITIGQVTDTIVYSMFGPQHYEQVAVRYLKTTLGSLPLIAVALFVILIAAPALEELLFRGFLQTYFKRYVGPKSAILLSALCFALFHLSTSQGIGNISLVASLFSLACFLGFIYERQGSLLASIGLHMTFNGISSLRILFFSEM